MKVVVIQADIKMQSSGVFKIQSLKEIKSLNVCMQANTTFFVFVFWVKSHTKGVSPLNIDWMRKIENKIHLISVCQKWTKFHTN